MTVRVSRPSIENGWDIAHQHIAVRRRAKMTVIELREMVAEKTPGKLHGLITQPDGWVSSWDWYCQLCSSDGTGFCSDAEAWHAFIEHEDQVHVTLAPIIPIDGRSRHAG